MQAAEYSVCYDDVEGKGEGGSEILTWVASKLINVLCHEIPFGIATEWNVVNSVRSLGTKLFVLLGLDFGGKDDWGDWLGRKSLIVVFIVVVAARFGIIGSRINAICCKRVDARFWCSVIVGIGLGKSSENVKDVSRPISSL